MEFDRELFLALDKGKSSDFVFRSYQFIKPTITYGYPQRINELIDTPGYVNKGYEIVRRPTGGGIVFHDLSDYIFTYAGPIPSSPVPETVEGTFLWFSKIMLIALKEININAELIASDYGKSDPLCFAGGRKFELQLDGEKILGLACRRGRKGFLMQGSLKTNIV